MKPRTPRWFRLGLVGGLLATMIGLGVAVARSASREEPDFVLAHSIDIDAPPPTVWRALLDVRPPAEWNPYLLDLEGDLVVGGGIVITIVQRNWDEPMVLPVTLVTVEPGEELGWTGSVLSPGVHDTHHFFRLHDLGDGRTRFDHVETFRGVLARWIHDEESLDHTRAAFQAMNESLARRAEELASPPPRSEREGELTTSAAGRP